MDTAVPAPRFIRREVSRQDTQQLIYWAAARLFRERGYHATSMRDIAAVVGIQPATMYHYYGGKEALLYTIMEGVLVDLLDKQAAVLRGSTSPVLQLLEMIRMHVRVHCERAIEAFIGDTELRALNGELHQRIMAYRDQYQKAFRGVLEDGVRQGVFAVPDVHVTANILLVMATSAVSWVRADGRLSLDEIANMHATLALQAVLAPAGHRELDGV